MPRRRKAQQPRLQAMRSRANPGSLGRAGGSRAARLVGATGPAPRLQWRLQEASPKQRPRPRSTQPTHMAGEHCYGHGRHHTDLLRHRRAIQRGEHLKPVVNLRGPHAPRPHSSGSPAPLTSPRPEQPNVAPRCAPSFFLRSACEYHPLKLLRGKCGRRSTRLRSL